MIKKQLSTVLIKPLGFDCNLDCTYCFYLEKAILYKEKKVRTSLGETQIDVPRDRDATFNPMIIPKRGNMVDGIENIFVSLYAKGMSNSDIED